MELNNIVDKIFEIIENRKTVSKLSCTKEDVRTIMKAVEAVNSVSEFTSSVGGVRLDQLELPEWVKHFVFPPKVSIMSGFDFDDIVVRPEVADFVYDEEAIKKAAYRISSSQKQNPKFRNAVELRGDVATLGNIHFSMGDKTRQDSEEVFFPVPLDPDLDAKLGKSWSNASAEAIIKKFFIRNFDIV